MRLLRVVHLPVLIAWVVVVAVVGWLASHPRLLAPYTASLVSRHLLRIEHGGLRVRDFRMRAFEGMDLYGVSLTLPSADGGMTLVAADTVRLGFSLQGLLAHPTRVRRLAVSRPEVFVRASREDPDDDERRDRLRERLGLPHLSVDHLMVDDAHLEFSDGRGRLLERITGVDFRGAVATGDRLRVTLRGCNADWTSRRTRVRGLRGDLLVDADGFHTRELFGDINEGRVRAQGFKGWAKDLDLTVSGRSLSVAEVENLLDQTLGFVAQGDIDGQFTTVGDSVVFAGDFRGDLEGYQVEHVTVRVAAASDGVALSGLDGRINGARFRGTGHIDLAADGHTALLLEGEVEDVDLANGLVPGEEDLPPTDGYGRVRIEHVDAPQATRVSGVLREGFVATIPFDSCRFQVLATPTTVTLDSVDLWYRDLEMRVTGETDSSQVFTGHVDAASTDLASLPASWGWPDLGGDFAGGGELSGPLDDLRCEARLELGRFHLEPVTAAGVDAQLVVENVLGDPAYKAELAGDWLHVDDVPLGEFELAGTATARDARIARFRTARGDTAIELILHVSFTDSVHTLRLQSFRFGLEGTDWRLQEPATVTLGDGVFILPPAVLSSPRGSLRLDAGFERDVAVAGNLVLDNFNLGLLNPFVRTVEPLSGDLSADVVVGGEPGDPVVMLTAELLDAPFALARVDTMRLEGEFNQGTFRFENLDMVTEFGRVHGTGSVSHPGAGPGEFWPDADLDLQLAIRQGNWLFLEQFAIPALDRLDGAVEGQLEVVGTTTEPLIRGSLRSAPFHVHWLHLDELTGDIWADSEALVLGDLRGHKGDLALEGRIEVPMDLDLLSEPTSPLDGPFYMELEIPPDTDLEPLARATNAFVSAEGRGGAQVIVSGPLERPLYQGSVKIRDAGFVLVDQEEVYYDVSCDGVFRNDELIVTNIQGREGLKGRFSGDGHVLFTGLELTTFDVRLDLERFLVASLPDLRFVVNGRNTRLRGVKVGPDSLLVPHFSGHLDVVKGRFTGSFSEQAGGVDPRAATVAPDWLANLTLHGDPRTSRIVNRDMDLDLGGDLDLTRNEHGLFLRGTLDVNRGDMVVFNNKFKVVRGRLDFSSELGFDPQVDLEAETRYRLRSRYSSNSIIETIGVHVGGNLSQPVITFSSERGYSRAAIQRMLLGLEPHATPEGDSDALRSTGISAGFNVLEREIARELAIFDTFEIDQIQRQRETGGTGMDPLIGVGKYIGSDLYLKYAQGVRQDDRDFIVEYQINRHMLLQSEIRRRIDENQGQPTYNLDLKYRFEY